MEAQKKLQPRHNGTIIGTTFAKTQSRIWRTPKKTKTKGEEFLLKPKGILKEW